MVIRFKEEAFEEALGSDNLLDLLRSTAEGRAKLAEAQKHYFDQFMVDNEELSGIFTAVCDHLSSDIDVIGVGNNRIQLVPSKVTKPDEIIERYMELYKGLVGFAPALAQYREFVRAREEIKEQRDHAKDDFEQAELSVQHYRDQLNSGKLSPQRTDKYRRLKGQYEAEKKELSARFNSLSSQLKATPSIEEYLKENPVDAYYAHLRELASGLGLELNLDLPVGEQDQEISANVGVFDSLDYFVKYEFITAVPETIEEPVQEVVESIEQKGRWKSRSILWPAAAVATCLALMLLVKRGDMPEDYNEPTQKVNTAIGVDVDARVSEAPEKEPATPRKPIEIRILYKRYMNHEIEVLSFDPNTRLIEYRHSAAPKRIYKQRINVPDSQLGDHEADVSFVYCLRRAWGPDVTEVTAFYALFDGPNPRQNFKEVGQRSTRSVKPSEIEDYVAKIAARYPQRKVSDAQITINGMMILGAEYIPHERRVEFTMTHPVRPSIVLRQGYPYFDPRKMPDFKLNIRGQSYYFDIDTDGVWWLSNDNGRIDNPKMAVLRGYAPTYTEKDLLESIKGEQNKPF